MSEVLSQQEEHPAHDSGVRARVFSWRQFLQTTASALMLSQTTCAPREDAPISVRSSAVSPEALHDALEQLPPGTNLRNLTVTVGPERIPFGLFVHDDRVEILLDGKTYPLHSLHLAEGKMEITPLTVWLCKNSLSLTRTEGGVEASLAAMGYSLQREFKDADLAEAVDDARAHAAAMAQHGEAQMTIGIPVGANRTQRFTLGNPDPLGPRLAQN